jgi:hypothetical protein
MYALWIDGKIDKSNFWNNVLITLHCTVQLISVKTAIHFFLIKKNHQFKVKVKWVSISINQKKKSSKSKQNHWCMFQKLAGRQLCCVKTNTQQNTLTHSLEKSAVHYLFAYVSHQSCSEFFFYAYFPNYIVRNQTLIAVGLV